MAVGRTALPLLVLATLTALVAPQCPVRNESDTTPWVWTSSCLQLRKLALLPLPDGVYWLPGMPVPVLCDFSHDGGGWTLLLTAATRRIGSVLAVRSYNEHQPSLTEDYSILRHANNIRDLGHGGRFAYRIEAQAESGRRQWGGVWYAPRHYSFVHTLDTQTNVDLVKKFGDWTYSNTSIRKRMPWINEGAGAHPGVLTTAAQTGYWYGTLVAQETNTDFQHSPWINTKALHSGTVLYWMREEGL